MKRVAWLGLAGLLAVAALTAASYVAMQRFAGPTVLTIAAGPSDGSSARVMEAAAKLMSRHSELRLEIVPTAGPAESAAALDAGKVDLAVARSDIGLPVTGQTVAILRRDAVLFVTPQGGVATLPDLAGRRVGVIPPTPANETLLDLVMQQYEVPVISVTKVLLQPGDVEAAIRDGRVDALMVVGPAEGPLTTGVVADFVHAAKGSPTFIPVGEAAAMAQRSAALETASIVKGTFGASRPRSDLTTLALTERLMASASLNDSTVSELARELYEMRPQLAKALPGTGRIEAPETERGAQLTVHPGAQAYLDDDEQTFFDKYGDWIYILMMIGGVVGSGLAAVAARWRGRVNEQGLRLEHLLDILRRARDAGSDALDALELEADQILAEALASASRQHLDPQRLSAFSLALEQVRQAISERRRILRREPAAAPASPVVTPSPVIRAVSDRG